MTYKEVLIQTFRDFVNLCKTEHLTYFAAYGTGIGAVRHHGLIPWDDDIDVYMPRTDYNKLVAIMQSGVGKYALMQPRTPGYSPMFAKFYNRNTTLWEERQQPFVIGIYVDIFILDNGLPEHDDCVKVHDSYQSYYLPYKQGMNCWSWSDIWDKFSHGHAMGFKRLLTDKLVRSKKHGQYQISLYALDDQVQQYKECDWLVCYPACNGERAIFPKSWFVSSVSMQFEDFEVEMPVGYDSYLRQQYGNYMQAPPEDKRGSTHSHFYLNLEKGMTLEELKKELHL